MSLAIITGSSGLIGSEATKLFHEKGMDVIGIDNDMRAYFFGPEASTKWNRDHLQSTLSRFKAVDMDIRDRDAVLKLFETHKRDLKVVIHTAAQPSHDWAAREPFTDFHVNATG